MGALTFGLLAVPAQSADAYGKHQVWMRHPLPAVVSPPGHVYVPAAERSPASNNRAVLRNTSLPPSGAGDADLTADLATSKRGVPAGAVQAGALPVWIGPAAQSKTGTRQPATGLSRPGRVHTVMASQTQARKAGVNGVLLSLIRTDGVSAAGNVDVTVDYSSFANAFGGGYADRLRVVTLPSCALTTPQKPACRTQTPVRDSRDATAGTLTAAVTLAGNSPALATGLMAPQTSSPSGQLVMALTPAPNGDSGTYAATSLNPEGTWSAGGNTGDFSYSYPIATPPALGGAAPSVSLAYDAQSVDGRTAATNAQPSWVGEGWDYSPGYIERSYKSCDKDGISGAKDMCWGGFNATISLNSHSGNLVNDDGDTGHTNWRVSSDDGTTVQLLTGAGNGASGGVGAGEYWVVTTTDGTKYYFGADDLATASGGLGTAVSMNSTLTEPVYGPKSGDPCYNATVANAWCQMAYRWNLSYSVDPLGNVTQYTYGTETNYYARGTGHTSTSYLRGSYLKQISYGWTAADITAGHSPAAKVVFTTAERCTGSTSCSSYANLSSSTAQYWVDTPYDQNCASGASCSNYAPTFWTTKMVTQIDTSIWSGSGTTYNPVDTFKLTQTFKDPGDGNKQILRLDSIQHTGDDTLGGATGTLALQPTSFTYWQAPNRVPGTSLAAVNRLRMTGITTEAGGTITVAYAAAGNGQQACSQVTGSVNMPSSADSNTLACFPVEYYKADGTTAQDWFIKYLVSSITQHDNSTGAADAVTQYSYLGGAAWHRDDSELTESTMRTWGQFRGYPHVVTYTGQATSPYPGLAADTVTESDAFYLQGMNGDYKADGTQRSIPPVTAWDGTSITDNNELADTNWETQTYTASGGSVLTDTLNIPWQNAPVTATHVRSTANPKTLPDLTARFSGTVKTIARGKLHDGTWRTTETDTLHDTSTSPDNGGRPLIVDKKGDGTSADPETCTTATYGTGPAGSNFLTLPTEVQVVTGTVSSGACPALSSANAISDTRTYYNGAGNGSISTLGTLGSISAQGEPTAVTVLDHFDRVLGRIFTTKGATQYDSYGRTITTVDPNGVAAGTTFTPATGSLPTTIKATHNSLGWTTSTTLDPARNLTLTVTDPNSRVTSSTYDQLGRLTAVWEADRAKATHLSTPNQKFSYSIPGGTSPVVITTSALREGLTYSIDEKIYDGFLRQRQEQTSHPDGSTGRVITDTFYDSHGWVVKANGAFDDTSVTAPQPSIWVVADSAIASQIRTTYNGLGKPTTVALWSNNVEQSQTVNAYPGVDETDSTPAEDNTGKPTGGTPTSTFTDALGRTSALWTYNTWDPIAKTGGTVDGNTAHADKTLYGYNAAGQLQTVTDPNTHLHSYAYDLRGRQTQITDPDTGTSGTAYDAAGKTVSTTDANKQTVTRTYDILGRETGEYTQQPSGQPVGSTALWALNESAGLTAADASGSGNTATISGGVTWTPTDHSGSASFNGTSGTIASQASAVDTTKSLTFSIWAKLPATLPTTVGTLISQDGTTSSSFALKFNGPSGKWVFTHAQSDVAAPAYATVSSSATATPNTWTHLVGVYDATSGTDTLYVNGISQGSTTAVTSWSANGATGLGRARTNAAAADYFTGSLSNAQTYQRALPQAEVTELTAQTTALATQATWSYDTVGGLKGKPASSTRYSNGYPYTTTITGYDQAYRPLGAQVVIPADPADGALAGTYTATSTYTPNIGLLSTSSYPAAGGLPAETVNYQYNNGGQLLSNYGYNNTDYLTQALYTWFGAPQATTLGDMPDQVDRKYAYDPATFRPLTITDDAETKAAAVDQTGYTYNLGGQITSINDVQDGGTATDTQCFTYDWAQRLTTAWTDTAGTSTANTGSPTFSIPGIGGCNSATPSTAHLGGPAPYWHTYGYDKVGNRATDTAYDTAGNPTTRSYLYNTNQPDTLQSTSDGTTYTYDAAGNTLTRNLPSGPQQTLKWDPYERLSTVTDSATGNTTSYVYTADGTQLIRRDQPGGTSLYLPWGDELHLNGGITATRYYPAPGGLTVIRSSTGQLTYSFADHNGTATLTIPAATDTQAETRRYNQPYGDPRGNAPTGWPDDHTYLDKTTDTTTQLVDVGARKYDPVTGRFISADPVFQPSSPQEMGGYTYAGGNPIGESDPTGLCPRDQCDGSESPEPAGTTNPSGCDAMCVRTGGTNSDPNVDKKISHWLKKYSPQTNDGAEAYRLWFAALAQPVQNVTGNYWTGAAYGGQALCFGREACNQALRYYMNTGDLEGAKLIAAFYCFSHDCIHQGQYSAQEYRKGQIFEKQLGAEFLAAVGSAGLYEGDMTNGGCACRCSFAPTTPILLANGESRPIGKLKVGDRVASADPTTGRYEGPRVVQHIWINHDADLLDVVINDGHGHLATVHTTANHPFWDDTAHTWLRADQLKIGHALASTPGRHATVTAIQATRGSANRWNLTVAELHTYYIEAGHVPVLVHNAGCPKSLYHGSDVPSLVDISQNGLDIEAADGKHIDGVGGFFLATAYDDAVYYAIRRQGGVIKVTMSADAIEALQAAGAEFRDIPYGGPGTVSHTGQEFHIPSSAFGLYNDLQSAGEITYGAAP